VPAISRVAGLAHEHDIELIANPVSPTKAVRLSGLLSGLPRLTVVANLAEAQALTGKSHETTRHAAELLHHIGVETVLVTDGAKSVALATTTGVAVSRPPELPNGISVTGAGDALLAAYLASPDRHIDPLAALESSLRSATAYMKRSA